MSKDNGSVAREEFFRILGEQPRVRIINRDAPKDGPNPDVVLWSNMHEWAIRKDTSEYIGFLKEKVERFDFLQKQYIDNHARLAYYKGIADAISMMVEEVERWSADTPQKRGPAIQ